MDGLEIRLFKLQRWLYAPRELDPKPYWEFVDGCCFCLGHQEEGMAAFIENHREFLTKEGGWVTIPARHGDEMKWFDKAVADARKVYLRTVDPVTTAVTMRLLDPPQFEEFVRDFNPIKPIPGTQLVAVFIPRTGGR